MSVLLISFSDIIGTLLASLLGLAIFIGVFLLLRNLVLWYYKIHILVKNAEQQTAIQKAMLERLERMEVARNTQGPGD